MIRLPFTILLLLLASCSVLKSQAQQMLVNIHLSNGQTETTNMQEVDSLFYTSVYTQPTITTIGPVNTSPTGAVIDAEVATDSSLVGMERGICWSTSANPTIEDDTTTTDVGVGNFSVLVSGLSPNTTYYAKAYFRTATSLIYGNEISFTTLTPLYAEGPGVTDIDGNTYPTVIIGGQEWMAKNLRVTHRPIPDPITGDTIALNQQHYADYLEYSNSQYAFDAGVFYSWDFVEDTFNLCPVGWRVPSDLDWSTLRSFLDPVNTGVSNLAGGMMKAITPNVLAPGNWNHPNVGATNESGFSAIPTLYFQGPNFLTGSFSGSFYFEAEWWTTDSHFTLPSNSYHTAVVNDDQGFLSFSTENWPSAFAGRYHPVRCVKD